MSAETSRENERQWLVPEAEAQPVWDLFARVFRTTHRDFGDAFDGDPPFFVNPNWIIVGLVNNLQCLAYPPGGPEEIRDGLITWEDWEMLSDILEPEAYFERGGFYERDELGPLLDIMADEGAQTLYFINPSSQFLGSMRAGSASREGLKAAAAALHRSDRCYGIFGTLVFDDTGRWGLYIGEENVAILAAEPEIMERYLPEVGGLEVLRQRFADRIRQEVDPRESLYRLRAARAYRKWYAAMRWDWPFPEPPTVSERTEQAET